jgi:hypothetical protein
MAKPEKITKRLHMFCVYPHADEKTNVAANEVLRRLREVETRIADVRIVNLPDYASDSADPHWPISWTVDSFDNSGKQIVLEVVLLVDKLTSSITRF